MGDLAPNFSGYKVLTPDGYRDFAGVSFMGEKAVYRLTFENGIVLECTEDHELYQDLTTSKEAKDFQFGDVAMSTQGNVTLISREYVGIHPVFDCVEVENGHRFYANTILAANCEFLIFDETLINASTLLDMEGLDPIEKQGQVRWYKKPEKDKAYLIALDPAMGTGGNNAAIQVFELPKMIQVAEWMHNKTRIPQQIDLIQSIAQYIAEITEDDKRVFYSVENNTLGETALVSIESKGEENIMGVFISEPKKAGRAKVYRKGFNTTENAKIGACSKMKSLIEDNRMKIHSKPLISELKTFIAKGRSYEAKEGDTDDLVMATVLAVRMTSVIKEYDPSLDKHLRDHMDEIVEPLGFQMVSSNGMGLGGGFGSFS